MNSCLQPGQFLLFWWQVAPRRLRVLSFETVPALSASNLLVFDERWNKCVGAPCKTVVD